MIRTVGVRGTHETVPMDARSLIKVVLDSNQKPIALICFDGRPGVHACPHRRQLSESEASSTQLAVHNKHIPLYTIWGTHDVTDSEVVFASSRRFANYRGAQPEIRFWLVPKIVRYYWQVAGQEECRIGIVPEAEGEIQDDRNGQSYEDKDDRADAPGEDPRDGHGIKKVACSAVFSKLERMRHAAGEQG